MKYFVTGTDTNVGKTLVCAWLAQHLQADYWKPIQCGHEDGEGDREMVGRLSGRPTHPEAYRFSLPRSPHTAAEAEHVRIRLDACIAPPADHLIVEGAGGVLVPINEHEFMIDLIERLGFPVIVVARGILGGINHLLLTLAALRQRNQRILGVVFSGPTLPETVAAAETYGRTVILAHIPPLERVDFSTLQDLQVPEPLIQMAKIDAE